MQMNKKGFISLPLLVIGLVVILVILGLGVFLLNKIVDALGTTTIIYLGILTLLIVFHKFVFEVLMQTWIWIRAIINAIFGLIGIKI